MKHELQLVQSSEENSVAENSDDESLMKKIFQNMNLSSEMQTKFVTFASAAIFGVPSMVHAVDNTIKLNDESGLVYEDILPQNMQKPVEYIKHVALKKQSNFFESIAQKVGISNDQMKTVVVKKNARESFGEYEVGHNNLSSNVPWSGEDVYVASYNGTGMAMGDEEWLISNGETHMYNLDADVDMVPDGELITIERSALTEDDAILRALNEIVRVKKKFKLDVVNEAPGIGEDVDVSYTAMIQGGSIDSYKVVDVSKDSYGHYVAKIEVTMGRVI